MEILYRGCQHIAHVEIHGGAVPPCDCNAPFERAIRMDAVLGLVRTHTSRAWLVQPRENEVSNELVERIQDLIGETAPTITPAEQRLRIRRALAKMIFG